jgi:septal ring factor EnvC (AmiA/AmiB activator)
MIYKHNILRYSQSTSQILAFVFLALFFAFPIQAQTVKELELQRKQTLKNLETTNILLNQTKKSQRSSLNKLTIISKNINERKMLIKNMSFEIGKLDDQIVQLDHEKTKLETNLKKLKANYAKLVQESHINRSLSAKIMFVLSAESFDQSYRRLRYLQEYSEYRKEQVREIEGVKVQIQHKNDSLHIHKTTKVEVVRQKETETKNLTKDKQKVKVLLTDLQKKEKKLHADLKIQQKKANDLNNKIASIIAEEIRKAEAKRAAIQKKRQEEEENKSKTTKSTTKTTSKTELKTTTETSRPVTTSSSSVSVLTKEETLLSGNFERNQGRLPWPTSNGFISGHFGIHEHPVLKHVTTNNKGVYIQTPAGSSARAVFEGVVTQRFSVPGSNNGVIIQHGNYRTVYANLTQIFVREGDHVSAKQAIGKIYTDDDSDNKTELYFQVYNGRNVQNPENWIAR